MPKATEPSQPSTLHVRTDNAIAGLTPPYELEVVSVRPEECVKGKRTAAEWWWRSVSNHNIFG